MTSPPDKLFRDHLEQYQATVPPSAWDRVESGLHHRKTRRLWMKIAVAVSLFVAASVLLWPIQENSSKAVSPKTNENTPAPSAPSELQAPDSKLETEPVRKERIEPKSKTFQPNASPKKLYKKHHVDMAISPISVPVDKREVQSIMLKEDVLVEHQTSSEDIEPISTVVNMPVASSRQVVLYSAREVESRFLKKSPSAEATPESKSPSGFKKVMDIAANIKYDDGTYGDLRQKKNEILSLGFLDQKNEADKK